MLIFDDLDDVHNASDDDPLVDVDGQVGFHRYAGSRHFMSCCRRLLGLQHVYNQEVKASTEFWRLFRRITLKCTLFQPSTLELHLVPTQYLDRSFPSY